MRPSEFVTKFLSFGCAPAQHLHRNRRGPSRSSTAMAYLRADSLLGVAQRDCLRKRALRLLVEAGDSPTLQESPQREDRDDNIYVAAAARGTTGSRSGHEDVRERDSRRSSVFAATDIPTAAGDPPIPPEPAASDQKGGLEAPARRSSLSGSATAEVRKMQEHRDSVSAKPGEAEQTRQHQLQSDRRPLASARERLLSAGAPAVVLGFQYNFHGQSLSQNLERLCGALVLPFLRAFPVGEKEDTSGDSYMGAHLLPVIHFLDLDLHFNSCDWARALHLQSRKELSQQTRTAVSDRPVDEQEAGQEQDFDKDHVARTARSFLERNVHVHTFYGGFGSIASLAMNEQEALLGSARVCRLGAASGTASCGSTASNNAVFMKQLHDSLDWLSRPAAWRSMHKARGALRPILEVVVFDCIDVLFEQDLVQKRVDELTAKVRELVRLSASSGMLVVFTCREKGYCSRSWNAKCRAALLPEGTTMVTLG